MTVVLEYVPECPGAEPARRLIAACLARLGLVVTVEERVVACLSPTIRIDGVDVSRAWPAMGAAHGHGSGACRLRLPSADELLSALSRAAGDAIRGGG